MLALTPTHEHVDVGGYSIHIGVGNEFVLIFRGIGDEKTEVNVTNRPGILDPNNFQSFWIGWAEGFIEVGQGEVRDSSTRLLSWQDPSPIQIQSVAVASGHAEAETGGQWQFVFDNGACVVKS